MHRLPRVLAVGGVFVLGVSIGIQAKAEDVAGCPREGLVTKAKNNVGDYTVTWRGADPSERYICISIGEGPGYGLNYAKELRRLYTWYDVTNYIIDSSNREKIRTALGAILAGQTNEVKIDISMGMVGKPYSWSQTDTWRRVGPEVLAVDGHPINTIKLQQETKAGAGSNYNASWDLWYDPAAHLFLKGHITSGTNRTGDYQVLHIGPP